MQKCSLNAVLLLKNDCTQSYHRSMYSEIHIWEFPPTRAFIKLNGACRQWLFGELRVRYRTSHLLSILNTRCQTYGINRKYNSGHICSWMRGCKRDRGKIRNIRIPLWVLIEFSKLLSSSTNNDNVIMRQIEKRVVYCAATGKSIPIKPKFPLLLTPELVSVIFNLCGDGCIGNGIGISHYRQINKIGLQNFTHKLHNSFGDFKETIVEDSKIIVPRVITDFYQHYFGINDCRWNTARIPVTVKKFEKEFLVAGLAAFIVDEGHIGDHVELYSSNRNLLGDLREIAKRLGYDTTDIKPKHRYGVLNGYRFLIKKRSISLLYRDIKELVKRFPTCGLAHKSAYLELMVKIGKRGWQKRPVGVTKNHILNLLQNPVTVRELSEWLLIPAVSLREHLSQLQATSKVKRFGKRGRALLWMAT